MTDQPDSDTPEAPVEFSEVIRAEADEVRRRRQLRGVSENATVAGLSLSGGGIRSAAVCLGALQGLHSNDALHRFDYLSTVSGGGYIGSCLSVGMSDAGGGNDPFGDDVRDNMIIAHLRNYSNYLLPRNRSGIRNWLEATAIILRGLLANAIAVAAFLVPAVILTILAFPSRDSLSDPNFSDFNFLPRLVGGFAALFGNGLQVQSAGYTGTPVPMIFPLVFVVLLAAVLTVWAMLRTLPALDSVTNDTRSFLLRFAFALLAASLVLVLLDLQPLLIGFVLRIAAAFETWEVGPALLTIAAAMTALATFAARIGRFLESSRRTGRLRTILLRGTTKLLLFLGALLLPALLWLIYAWLYQWALEGGPYRISFSGSLWPDTRFGLLVVIWIVTVLIMLALRANNYSLHWFYRDRLSAAFLVGTKQDKVVNLDATKVSDLAHSKGPFPIINAALNVQGSLEANKRGRNADFFSFTPFFTGSELTGYVRTADIEDLDPRLDVGTAMAVSGAAASANMGSNTVRLLSPTLSLLNVRLGYYLLNPRYIGELDTPAARAKAAFQRGLDRFYLLIEMFNGLTERRRTIYLTDGGHIENLGVYELLRRKCGLIFAIDAEADPELACGSLLRLERYARIDLGVRITLPWEAIARQSRTTSAAIQVGGAPCEFGPHCTIGRILYGHDEQGLLVYLKSSLSGDEKDYVLDYARRFPAFPHESTSDQFFSEEQFEMYRALGFHMVQGLFGRDRISFLQGEPQGFADEDAARAALLAALRKQERR